MCFKAILFLSWSFWFVSKQTHHQQELSSLSRLALRARVLEEAVFKDTKMRRIQLVFIHIWPEHCHCLF